MKYIFSLILLLTSTNINAQIEAEKFGLSIETKLSDTLQRTYEQFLNNEVEKVSIVKLKKRYDNSNYCSFLKNKKFYQSRRKWIKRNSYQESIIVEGAPYDFTHFDSIVFDYEYMGIYEEFVQFEYFLDSVETKLALSEMFNGEESDIVDVCYSPEHAVIFYNSDGKISGVYEVCFECSNVKIGIVGTRLFPKDSLYLMELFKQYEGERKRSLRDH